MTEIPEHLRKRAEAARAKAQVDAGGGTPSAEAPAGDAPTVDEKIPGHLLDRGTPASDLPAPPTGGPAVPTGGSGPDGHNQRLLTVVKSGSIQDTKATPQDKVHVWPHLLLAEFLAALAVTAFLLLFSIVVNAPLLELADFNKTPNPSKRPEDRKFAISLMSVHLMFWAVLVMIGSFFRGPGFNFVFPWNSGVFFEL